MRLVIAEKSSAAKVYADVLGAKSRKNGSYEGNGYVVSWCIGHLLELAEPHVYDDKYARWRYEDLPILPDKWQYTANKSTQKQLKILCDLINRPDVDCIINAADAGREGELICRLVLNYAKNTKKIMRLWVNSMEESAIADSFKNLRDGADYDSLYHAALCRAKADWAVGMNFSRLFSVLYNAQLRVGRVQTPTLAMIVERDDKISNFVKEPFYTVGIGNGAFTAEREKLKDKQTADDISASCDGSTAIVKEVKRQEKSEMPPKLYDLTALQREANRLFGYTAAQTLNCVQALYEQKIVTYPRTDSRYLTEDMAGGIPPLVAAVRGVLPFLSAGGVPIINAHQVVNNRFVTDHTAIVPTPTMPTADLSALPTAERNVLYMICTRLVSAVSDKHTYAETVVTIECGGEIFTLKGKTVINDGWKAIEQAFTDSTGKKSRNSDASLPELYEGQSFTAKSSVREGFTQPPKHFSEDLLLSAMENATADDMPENMPGERRGLGTPATRANIIETLIKSDFLSRKDKSLLPTEKGVNLIKILPEAVKSPMLTAEWENHLSRVQKGEISASDFMIAINKFVSDTVETHAVPAEEYNALFPSNRQSGKVVGRCPRCQNNVSEHKKGFFCSNETCKFGLFKENRFFTAKKKTITREIAAALLSEGRIFMSGLHSEKTGKSYNATIILDDSGEGYTSFKMEFEQKN